MGNSIRIDVLQAIAENARRTMRAKGGFPARRRVVTRSEEKDEALFRLRLNACIKYGVKRFPDGSYRLQEK
jgi:hypothetical protein